MKNLFTIISLVLAALLAGCNGQQAQMPAAETDGVVRLRVAYMPNLTHAVPLIGFAEGGDLQTMPGVAVESRVIHAGPDMMEALKAGSLDAVYVGPAPFINSWARTQDFVVLTNTANGGSVLVARQGSGIHSVADLAGRRIAVPQTGNTQDVLMRAILVQNNLRTTDRGGNVTVLDMAPADIFGLMQRGELDAALVPEPWGVRSVREAGASVVLEWNQLPMDGAFPQTLLVARRSWVESHPEAARELVTRTDALTRRVAEDPGALAETISAEIRRTSLKDIPVNLIRDGFARVEFTSSISQQDLEQFADLIVRVGYQRTRPDFTNAVHQTQ